MRIAYKNKHLLGTLHKKTRFHVFSFTTRTWFAFFVYVQAQWLLAIVCVLYNACTRRGKLGEYEKYEIIFSSFGKESKNSDSASIYAYHCLRLLYIDTENTSTFPFLMLIDATDSWQTIMIKEKRDVGIKSRGEKSTQTQKCLFGERAYTLKRHTHKQQRYVLESERMNFVFVEYKVWKAIQFTVG